MSVKNAGGKWPFCLYGGNERCMPLSADPEFTQPCESQKGCTACTGYQPQGGIDVGKVCVWCPQANICKPYLNKSMVFPCGDATHEGKDFPGGDSCLNNAN
eukprot:NODE_1299_length_566_cov_1222.394584_g1224_i0.p2 GENE.NODE_1299_length_566_cov_1222.394584_g1224_i0~~NODE_1299_length_566_cov_1222.394584_g1224_i0.p2  ORF type:complete len:101 (-),score=23.20 NODE_1299_length_566_cov_1222.394584_g1224_i0:132-434(-)